MYRENSNKIPGLKFMSLGLGFII